MKKCLFFCLGSFSAAMANMDWTLNKGSADFHILHSYQGIASAALGTANASGQSLSDLAAKPLSIDTNQGIGIALSRQYLPSQIGGRLDLASFNYQGKHSRSALVLGNQNFNALQGFDEYGRSTGDFSAGSFSLGLEHQRSWGNWNLAGRMSWLNQHIQAYHSQALLLDGALLWQRSEWRLGAQLLHAGWASPFRNSDPYLPLEASLGSAWTRTWNPLIHTQILADLRYRNDEGYALPLGLEFNLGSYLSLRGGCEFKKDPSPTGGLGLHYNGFNLDYAIQGRGVLGLEQRFGLSKAF